MEWKHIPFDFSWIPSGSGAREYTITEEVLLLREAYKDQHVYSMYAWNGFIYVVSRLSFAVHFILFYYFSLYILLFLWRYLFFFLSS